MKLPEPKLYEGITTTDLGKYKSTEDGYTADQMRQAIKDAYEDAATMCEVHARGWENNPGRNPLAGFIAASNLSVAIRTRSQQ